MQNSVSRSKGVSRGKTLGIPVSPGYCMQSSSTRRLIMKVAVLGAGAIGAYVGAALDRAGVEVHLVARGLHLEAMRRHGVQVRSPRGDWIARPHATDDPAEIG